MFCLRGGLHSFSFGFGLTLALVSGGCRWVLLLFLLDSSGFDGFLGFP